MRHGLNNRSRQSHHPNWRSHFFAPHDSLPERYHRQFTIRRWLGLVAIALSLLSLLLYGIHNNWIGSRFQAVQSSEPAVLHVVEAKSANRDRTDSSTASIGLSFELPAAEKPYLGASTPTVQTADPMQQAYDYAADAVSLNRSAHALNDWQLVAERWQSAIAQLQTVATADPNYNKAQAKVSEYQSNLVYAQQRASRFSGDYFLYPVELPAIQPAAVADLACTPVGAVNEAPLSFTQLGFRAMDSGRQLIGCLTNHADHPLTHIALTYQATSERDQKFLQAGFDYLQVGVLQPGQTAPFQSQFALPSHVTQLHLSGVAWRLTNQGNEPMHEVAIAKDLAL